MKLCPCCSNKNYIMCCEPFILGNKYPKTPKQLMRSRYTAYTMANIDYIKKTMKYPALEGFDELEAKSWATKIKWQKLQIIKSNMKNPKEGYVEFIASFEDQDKLQKIHELSKFIKEDNIWYYVSGKHFPTNQSSR